MEIQILSGIPGCGKTTWCQEDIRRGAVRCSADDFFLVEGKYTFDATKLDQAHGECFTKYLHWVKHTETSIIVDNTNIHAWEISPYVLGAQAFGRRVKIVQFLPKKSRLDYDWIKFCTARNTHGVLPRSIEVMWDAMKARDLPPWWEVHGEYV